MDGFCGSGNASSSSRPSFVPSEVNVHLLDYEGSLDVRRFHTISVHENNGVVFDEQLGASHNTRAGT